MQWYENPTIVALLGAILGAVITGGISLFIWRKTRKIKRITCVVDNPNSLLSIADPIKDSLKVSYGNNPVSSAYLFKVDIENTGTSAIENQPVIIHLSTGSKIVDYKIKTMPELGFGEIKERENEENKLDLNVNLLNISDRLIIEILSIGNLDDSIEIGLKNKDVVAKIITQKLVESMLDKLSKNPFFKFIEMMTPFGDVSKGLASIYLVKKFKKR